MKYRAVIEVPPERTQSWSETEMRRLRELSRQLCSETDFEKQQDLVEELRHLVRNYLPVRHPN